LRPARLAKKEAAWLLLGNVKTFITCPGNIPPPVSGEERPVYNKPMKAESQAFGNGVRVGLTYWNCISLLEGTSHVVDSRIL
jgi:hypothetical protein